MFKCVSLNNKNLHSFLRLNNLREKFNDLNEDFYEDYINASLAKRFFLRKDVTLLKYKNEIIGYLWIKKTNKYYDTINSMYIDGIYDDKLSSEYRYIIDAINPSKTLLYNCEKNTYNYTILKNIGFKKRKGTYEMYLKLASYNNVYSSDISFEILNRGKQENIRCTIQNAVFKNDSRIPLTIDDMYFDEIQNYYFDDGAILVKRDNNYIGYGQIINTRGIPTIVNVGILEEYRGRGYGKDLMLYLLNLLKLKGFEDVNLKVDSNNHIALNLYNSLGFNVLKETILWEYKT